MIPSVRGDRLMRLENWKEADDELAAAFTSSLYAPDRYPALVCTATK